MYHRLRGRRAQKEQLKNQTYQKHQAHKPNVTTRSVKLIWARKSMANSMSQCLENPVNLQTGTLFWTPTTIITRMFGLARLFVLRPSVSRIDRIYGFWTEIRIWVEEEVSDQVNQAFSILENSGYNTTELLSYVEIKEQSDCGYDNWRICEGFE